MNTNELVSRLAENRDMTQEETRNLIDLIVQNICDNLARGNDFTIPGLGTFGTHIREKRRSYNPHHEKYMMLPPKRVVDFTPSNVLKDEHKDLGIDDE